MLHSFFLPTDKLPSIKLPRSFPVFSHAAKASTCGTISSDKSRRTTAELGGSGTRELIPASELIPYMNPTDRSGSNNATTAANAPISGGNDHSTSSKPPQAANTAPATDTTTITRKPGTNLAEIDPSAFAQTLSHRLEKVKESRGKMERLLSRMQPVGFSLLIALPMPSS